MYKPPFFVFFAILLCGCGAESTTSEPSQPKSDAQVTMERVEARPGIGKASQKVGGGLFGKKIQAGIQVREKVQLDVALKHQLDLYRATHGSFPKTEDAFWKFVEENQIKLPKLPAGQKYVYEPATGKLMVERPTQ